jgi:hypothetical protein
MKVGKGSKYCFMEPIYKRRACITIGRSGRVLKGINPREQTGNGVPGQRPIVLGVSPLEKSLRKFVEEVGDWVSD